MVVSALCSALYGGAVDTCSAVDAHLAMEYGGRQPGRFCECAGCGPAGDGGTEAQAIATHRQQIRAGQERRSRKERIEKQL